MCTSNYACNTQEWRRYYVDGECEYLCMSAVFRCVTHSLLSHESPRKIWRRHHSAVSPCLVLDEAEGRVPGDQIPCTCKHQENQSPGCISHVLEVCVTVRSQVLDAAHAPTAFYVEASLDGENWGRTVEVTITKDWDSKIETFSWGRLDVQPDSVFAIRSQKDPSLCLGATPIPDPVEPEKYWLTKPIDYGTGISAQRCDDKAIPQWWFFGPNGLLHNAAEDSYILYVGANGTTELNDEAGGMGGEPDGLPDGNPNVSLSWWFRSGITVLPLTGG